MLGHGHIQAWWKLTCNTRGKSNHYPTTTASWYSMMIHAMTRKSGRGVLAKFPDNELVWQNLLYRMPDMYFWSCDQQHFSKWVIVRFDCYFLFSVKDPCVLWNNYTALPTETSLRVIQSWFVIAPWVIISINKRWSLAWTSLYKYERYGYRVKDYLNVCTENGSGYCMHSDCVIGYFANNHYC